MAYVKTVWTNGATALSAEHMNNIEDGIAALDASVTSLDSSKVDKETNKGLSTNDYTTEEKTKLAGIDAGAEVNQNAFGKVKVGSTTIASDAKEDTLELVAGDLISITPDATNDKVTISSTANVIQRKLVQHEETKTISAQSTGFFNIDINLSDASDYVGISEFWAVSSGVAILPASIVQCRIYSKNNLELGLFNSGTTSFTIAKIYVGIAYKG